MRSWGRIENHQRISRIHKREMQLWRVGCDLFGMLFRERDDKVRVREDVLKFWEAVATVILSFVFWAVFMFLVTVPK